MFFRVFFFIAFIALGVEFSVGFGLWGASTKGFIRVLC